MNRGDNVIGERIRAIREQRGLTRNELAKQVEISATALYYIEKGINIPSSLVLSKIAQVLEVSADYLLGLTDDPTPKDKEFDLAAYLPNEILLMPKELRKIGQRLIEIAEMMEKILGRSQEE